MSKKIDRRDFIRGAAITGAGLALGGGLLYGRRALAEFLAGGQADIDRAIRDHKQGLMSDEDAQATVEAYMTSSGSSSGSRVVHIHDPDATNWDFETGWYGDYVDQQTVNTMVDRGVMELTGASTVADAWGSLLPEYTSGEAIAIKVNFNNGWSCNDDDNQIDALIHPINAIVQGLRQIGVAEEDIWIYDAIRYIPDRFADGCEYSSVQFFGDCRQSPGWASQDPDATMILNPPSGPLPYPIRVADVLIHATYLINIPIIKAHGSPGVTLSFKNHLGTIDNPGMLHDYIDPGSSLFSSEYSPYVELYQNPHIGAKTVLTLGDGLFGCWSGHNHGPKRWSTFNNSASNSLFFATDPVALDSVMYDLLAAETSIKADADCYLNVAANAGLGAFEHGDPWGSGYSQINYRRVEL